MDITAIMRYYVLIMPTRRPLETVLKPDAQKVFDHFSSCFNIRILFFSPGGEELNVGLNRPDSDYCRLIQEQLYGEQACLNLDEEKRREAARSGNVICYQCHAGLVEAIKPIYFENSLLGYVAIGQFRSARELPERARADWQSRVGSTRLEEAFASLQFVDQEKIDDTLGLFSVLVDYIVSQRMITRQGSIALNDLVSYMESNPQVNLSLDDAARMVHKSPSTVSHLFKSKLGASFKQTQTEIKLRKAEEHMAADPEMPVGEVAAKVGYVDPLYFSRIYKKHRGIPPSKFSER
ncbi:MAG: PocR ligand-binding domain-containing protein [Chloroflexi bacterium]|nr:PocR ligand-binding domain-containing protein [Chloroflexota bacterium]